MGSQVRKPLHSWLTKTNYSSPCTAQPARLGEPARTAKPSQSCKTSDRYAVVLSEVRSTESGNSLSRTSRNAEISASNTAVSPTGSKCLTGT